MSKTKLAIFNNGQQDRATLLLAIKKSRQTLKSILIRNETLKLNLDLLKKEYMVKIGSLIAKDNHLDLDIIRSRNILRLLKDGLTYEEALDELKNTYYQEQLEIDKEEENIREAEQVFEKGINSKSDEVKNDVKKLWKHLIGLFHPDLTQDTKEKKKREEIMKQINMAYEQGDLEKLKKIEQNETVSSTSSLEKLEDTLVMLQNEIIKEEKNFHDLKKTEWYKWYLKLQKNKISVRELFADVEKKLLDDIVVKIKSIRDLRTEIEKMQKEN